MKLRDSRQVKTPDLMIIPMIDIMFFLLVFFMISTMYMVDVKTIPIKLPTASNASATASTTFSVSIKKDGSITVEAACKQIGISKIQWYVLERRAF